MVSYLAATLALFTVPGPVHPHAIKPFYHPFYLDVTHVWKDNRPSHAREGRTWLAFTNSSYGVITSLAFTMTGPGFEP